MSAAPAQAVAESAAPAPALPEPSRPARRWFWPAIVVVAVVWAVALGTLAATRSNVPTLNRVQFRRADALAFVEVAEVTPGGVRAVVREAVAGGRGPVPEGLAEGTTITIARFPQGAAGDGDLVAAPVRRVERGWAVAEPPEGLPDLVYSLSNPGDWSDLKAAAEALSAGRDAYR